MFSTGVVACVGDESFAAFYARIEPPLRRALMATYGPEIGREAAADALAWAWAHQDRLATMEHPLPYLYRVGRTSTRGRRVRILHARSDWSEPWVEPALAGGLAALSPRQRVAVVLVHGYAWTLSEVATLLGVRVTTVQNHLERGLKRLRDHLKAATDE
jgi:DNA-directed RNA polymerase specialized sigma24 family protein